MVNKNFETDNSAEDFSLPDMEASWQNMKSLLDENDNRKRVLPFYLRLGIVAIVLLISAALGTRYIGGAKPGREISIQDKTINNDVSASGKKAENNTGATAEIKSNNSQVLRSPSGDNKPTGSTPGERVVQNSLTHLNKKVDRSIPIGPANNNDDTPLNAVADTQNKSYHNNNSKNHYNRSRLTTQNKLRIKTSNGTSEIIDQPKQINPGYTSLAKEMVKPTEAGERGTPKDMSPATIDAHSALVMSDTAKKVVALSDSVKKKEPTSNLSKEGITKKNKRTSLLLSAGIGLQQAIPIENQQRVSVNYNGNKSVVSDYTPSVYMRLEKEGKWFIQAEYKYNAAQLISDFAYSRKTTLIESSKMLSTAQLYLKKTYYHQFPLSFNYFILPHFSIGTGMSYNLFQGAVIERQTTTRSLATQQESVTKEIMNIKHFNDSFLFKSQLQLLVQMEYQWKRFSFAARYTADLQPFIKYTQPDGIIMSRKNHMLLAIIRYRLWQKKL